NSGVPTYRIRSRHESSIHNFGLATPAGATGTVCRRENAGPCCMSSNAKFSLIRRENQSRSLEQIKRLPRCLVRAMYCWSAKLKWQVNKTQNKRLKEHEQERDFFCVVSDAFRIFARRSSVVLGSAWAFTGAVIVIVVWLVTGPTFHFSDTWQLIINTATTI